MVFWADTLPVFDTIAAVSTRVTCTSQIVHYNNKVTSFDIWQIGTTPSLVVAILGGEGEGIET